MLIQYCKSIGKSSISYIESTGIGWAADEIDNFEKAEKKISALTSRRRAWNTVRSSLEIPERKATESELKYCDLWINSQHIDVDLIRHAYDKCINKNGKISFAYMNGIIKRYFERGITDITSALKLDEQNRAEIEARKAERKAAAANSITDLAGGNTENGRYASTYDTDDIEAILDAEWMSEEVGNDGDYNYDD
jgi:DnaD/phage-associated family protein